MAEKTDSLATITMASSGLNPNKVYFFDSSSGDFSDELHVLDLTPSVSLANYTGTINDDFRKEVERVTKEKKHDSSSWSFELKRSTFSSTMQFHDASAGGAVVAELDMSILKRFGAWKIQFPDNSPHSSHVIEITPSGIFKKEEKFVKDSVSYLWDLSDGGRRGTLSKEIDGKKMTVAEYVAKNWFQNSCVLLINTNELDQVVSLATCVSVLNRQA